MKLLFENHRTYAYPSLGVVPANYNPTRCANPCQPFVIDAENSFQRRVGSHLDKTRPAALKIWSSPIFKEQDQNVKLKTSIQEADKK